MGNIINIIIQLVSGGIGGSAAGKAKPEFSLGKTGDIIAGVLGGIGGGQLLGALGIGSGGLDIAGIIASILGGGIGGGALTAIVSTIKNAMGKK